LNYIVFDLEWNQSNTRKEPEVNELPFEIIDVGAIRMNDNLDMVGEFNQLIKPQVYTHLHHITSKIIHLHMQDLLRGNEFPEVMREFLDFCGEEYIFCTWGTLDLFELQRNMRFYGMEPLSNAPIKYLDVQKLYSIAFEDGKQRRALEVAIDALGMEKDIPFHRAFSDAYYTAKVLAVIPKEVFAYHSYDTFILPQSRKEEIKVEFPGYWKYISREFTDKREAMSDREVASTKCYICHKNVKKKIKWFSTSTSKHYYSIAECPIHGLIKYKARMKKTENESVYVVKTIKFIDEETYKLYEEKKDQIALARKNKKKAALSKKEGEQV